MWKLNLSSSTLSQSVSIFSDVTRRNPVAANQSPASSYRCVLPADRLEILCPVSTERERESERGMPSTLADIITIIILSLIFNTDWITVMTLNSKSSSFTGFPFISSNLKNNARFSFLLMSKSISGGSFTNWLQYSPARLTYNTVKFKLVTANDIPLWLDLTPTVHLHHCSSSQHLIHVKTGCLKMTFQCKLKWKIEPILHCCNNFIT